MSSDTGKPVLDSADKLSPFLKPIQAWIMCALQRPKPFGLGLDPQAADNLLKEKIQEACVVLYEASTSFKPEDIPVDLLHLQAWILLHKYESGAFVSKMSMFQLHDQYDEVYEESLVDKNFEPAPEYKTFYESKQMKPTEAKPATQ